MFRCTKCGESTKPREKCNLVIVETRVRTYVNKVRKKSPEMSEDDKALENAFFEKPFKTFSTNGTEIVKEVKLCEVCYVTYQTA